MSDAELTFSLFFSSLRERLEEKCSKAKDGKISMSDIRAAMGQSFSYVAESTRKEGVRVVAETIIPFLAYARDTK